IDNDAHNIKLKTLLETIGLCLSAKDEFKSDVIKEAVTTLLEDPVPPKALMRTVILSAQSLPDIKKFVLTVVVPKLILMRTWDLAPKVWDGVVMCVKVMAGNKDSEPTIRALIGLPLPQLRGILKIAPDTGVYLARLLRSLSAEEVEEVLSGKWAHLQSENSESQKKDKAKLIQEMSTGGSGSNKGVGR
ncbi:Sympk, partial [Symbiodinium microadriaticum]